jgi:uncharacterized coiled-coil DUF342 family protein
MAKTIHEKLAEVATALDKMSPTKAAELHEEMVKLRKDATGNGTLHDPADADSRVGRLALNALLAKNRNS